MEIRVLGSIELVVDDGSHVDVKSPMQRMILAVLASRAHDLVPATDLIDAMWGDDQPPTALRSLRTYVSRLRRTLGESLVSTQGSYGLGPTVEVDAKRFLDLAGHEPTSIPNPCEHWRSALRLWRGAPFGDLGDHEALRAAARFLDVARVDAEASLATALLAENHPGEAVRQAELTIATDPFRESTWTVLVRALTADGRAADALRAFQRATSALAEAGLEPGSDLREAEAEALRGPTGRQASPPPTEPAEGEDPVPQLDLVGRVNEVEAVAQRLAAGRLVTIVGPGGVGKTSLALEVARRMEDQHDEGSLVVELAALTDGDAVADTIVTDAGIIVEGASSRSALRRLAERDLLLVLDNCEHVIGAAAEAAEAIFAGPGRVRLLCTSRERLGVRGEAVYHLQPLDLDVGPDGRSPAAELLRRRLRELDYPLEESDATDRAAQTIVEQLDGLPLAIEMAAARASTQGLVELAETLADDIGELESGYRGIDPRHRTLDATIRWSERLLDEADRQLLAELSVFAGSFTGADAESVCGPQAPAGVRHLVEQSLVSLDTRSSPTSYRLLETVRAHAKAQLSDVATTELARRHAHWVLRSLRVAEAELDTARERAGHQEYTRLFDEARAAHQWCRARDLSMAAELTLTLNRWARPRLVAEPFQWARALADRLPPGDSRRAAAEAVWAHHLADRGLLDDAKDLAERALLHADDPRAIEIAYDCCADVAMYRGELDTCLELVAMWRERSESTEYGRVMRVAADAMAYAYGERFEEAEAVLESAATIEPESPGLRGWLRYSAGEVALNRRPKDSIDAMEEAIALADEVGLRFLGGVARVSLASQHARGQDPSLAISAYLDLISFWLSIGDSTHLVTTLRNIVPLLHRLGASVAAAELLATVTDEGLAQSFGTEADSLEATSSELRRLLGPRYEAASTTGSARSIDEAARHTVEVLAELSPGD